MYRAICNFPGAKIGDIFEERGEEGRYESETTSLTESDITNNLTYFEKHMGKSKDNVDIWSRCHVYIMTWQGDVRQYSALSSEIVSVAFSSEEACKNNELQKNKLCLN
jgi:hypothetical protein